MYQPINLLVIIINIDTINILILTNYHPKYLLIPTITNPNPYHYFSNLTFYLQIPNHLQYFQLVLCTRLVLKNYRYSILDILIFVSIYSISIVFDDTTIVGNTVVPATNCHYILIIDQNYQFGWSKLSDLLIAIFIITPLT